MESVVSSDFDDIFRRLKAKKVKAGEVAKALSLTEGYVSKIKSGEKKLTRENFEAFNRAFGHIVRMDPALIADNALNLKSLAATVGVLEQKVSDLIANQGMLLEYIAQRVSKVDRVTRESVYFELNRLKVEQIPEDQNMGTQTGSGKHDSSLRKKRF